MTSTARYLYGGVEGLACGRGRLSFVPADVGFRVQDLAVQVAGLHRVLVHNAQAANPSCSQVDGGGAAQAPGTNYQGR